MSKVLQITVADERGVVVDTGWVEVPGVTRQGQELAGNGLYDHALEWGAQYGIMVDKDGAAQVYAEVVSSDPGVEGP